MVTILNINRKSSNEAVNSQQETVATNVVTFSRIGDVVELFYYYEMIFKTFLYYFERFCVKREKERRKCLTSSSKIMVGWTVGRCTNDSAYI